MTAPDAAVPDFTKKRDPIEFIIAPDTFRAPPVLGGYTLKRVASMYTGIGDLGAMTDADGAQKAIDVVAELMQIIMPGAHGRRFAERLLSDGNPGDPEADPPIAPSPPPIDLMGEAMPAFMYLLERYGLRPTVPSSASPAGSTEATTGVQNDGTSSTDGASPTE